MGQREKEKELKELMMLEDSIDAAIKKAETHLKIFHLASENCHKKQVPLKEELRVR